MSPELNNMKNKTQINNGLYLPQLESDACGVGFVANIEGTKSHDIVSQGLTMLERMSHRGASGIDEHSGDGAGITVQMPDQFFRTICRNDDIELPEYGSYGAVMVFMPKSSLRKQSAERTLHKVLHHHDLEILYQREVPCVSNILGDAAGLSEPDILQYIVSPIHEISTEELERNLYVFRKHMHREISLVDRDELSDFYIVSASYQTLIYKGQLTSLQLRQYFPDLRDPLFTSAIAMVHARFSTNTLPQWKLAQPFRRIAHNGEINTIQGNVRSWKSRAAKFESPTLTPAQLRCVHPVIENHLSDSASFDSVFEFLSLNGRTIPQALSMMIPEAWHHDDLMDLDLKAYYHHMENLMSPWDGPAAICFTDGVLIGATLDRNGLRPLRYCITKDHRIVMASEVGVLDLDPELIVENGCLQPGKMLIVNLDEHRVIKDEEIKSRLCRKKPYRNWIKRNSKSIDRLQNQVASSCQEQTPYQFQTLQKIYGINKESIDVMLSGLLKTGKEPIGSMGKDTPLAVLSMYPQHISNYFQQNFAQVTNPPIDPIRERKVMSLHARIGPIHNPLKDAAYQSQCIRLDQPILTEDDYQKILSLPDDKFMVGRIKCTFSLRGKTTLEDRLKEIEHEAQKLVESDHKILILSDVIISDNEVPIPSLVSLGAIHHHLIECQLRAQVSLVVVGGDLIDSHHMATLIGYGADAIHPWMALSSIQHMSEQMDDHHFAQSDAEGRYITGIGKGILKVMSKMGISTLSGYHGAQQFEILGLDHEIVNRCFRKSISRIGGRRFIDIQEDAIHLYERALIDQKFEQFALSDPGNFQWKRTGEKHLFSPKTIHYLQQAVRQNRYDLYTQYATEINDQSIQSVTLRGQFEFVEQEGISIDEVEPADQILKRFSTGAMSFGSLSYEAHSNLAIAMNRIGGKSNSGEGGEDPSRYTVNVLGDSERSSIKQVASGRFGVTMQYLSEADEIQIKMAQGAKPGEGGQLPGEKVDEWIARVRYSTPGITLISPPPHHDIYSIEDLAQLIFDLKNANRKARINVKLVSKAGVGVIASGVAKAKADAILISGHDGGTGASPLGSIHHAGLPWELGLAEAHQTLVRNGLRDRVILQTDGQLRTGRDIAIAAILGAEEWGIATAALVAQGCIMMRKCHVNTCPVGVATQDENLRKRFNAKPEHVVHFFQFIVEDLRHIMATLGIRTVNELIGRTDLIQQKKDHNHNRYQNVDLSIIQHRPEQPYHTSVYQSTHQNHHLGRVLDRKIIAHASHAIQYHRAIHGVFKIQNTDRCTGTMFSHEIYRAFKHQVKSDNQFSYRFIGSAGQSFAAFLEKGIQFTLEGEANDYCGKGLSGGRVIVCPSSRLHLQADHNTIIGNVAFYGATSGTAFIRGLAGERFCVRNSGIDAVVEGVGNYCCEYMTGGQVAVIGPTGKYFATGMSGGLAYVFDPEKQFFKKCNTDTVDLLPVQFQYEENLRKLLRQHFLHTSSKKALYILQDWKRLKKKFVMVIPKEMRAQIETQNLKAVLVKN